jgi:hypothetical protein
LSDADLISQFLIDFSDPAGFPINIMAAGPRSGEIVDPSIQFPNPTFTVSRVFSAREFPVAGPRYENWSLKIWLDNHHALSWLTHVDKAASWFKFN